MIKAFLFDYGGVMSSGGKGTEPAERLATHLGIDFNEADGLLKRRLGDFVMGKISHDSLWKEIEALYGAPISNDKRDIWNSWEKNLKPYPDMLALLSQLKTDGYTVGLLSNVVPHVAKDLQEHGAYQLFDFTILSCEAGYAKPDKEIYELALSKLPGVKPEEVIFVDDQERCLVPAKEMGMHTILAQNPTQIKEDIHNLLS